MHSITLLSKREVAVDTPLYIFSKPDGFTFRAGQYVSMKVVCALKDDKGEFRSFSLASAPCEDVLAFAMRRGTSAFKQSLDCLSVGQNVEITNAVGKFVLPYVEDGTKTSYVFLSAGVGVTPIRSILLQAAHEQRKEAFVFFSSNTSRESSPFYDEFESLRGLDLSMIHTFTGECPRNWRGEMGRISTEMIKKYVPNYQESTFFLVGTGAFVESMRTLLADLVISPQRIVADSFGKPAGLSS